MCGNALQYQRLALYVHTPGYAGTQLLTGYPATKNVTSTLCQAPVRNHTHLVSYIGVAGAIIAFVAYLLRIGSRAVGEGSLLTILGWDDATITLAVAMMIPVSVFSPILRSTSMCVRVQ